jgi:alanyl-tRNA synthetase
MVRPERLRFDFFVREAPTAEQLRQVEDLVNRRIIENHPVRPFVTTREYAAEIGALAFFEEKYGEFVRVLEIDDFSRELCGGTHVSSTSQIGLFKITGSQSVGANTRRIEAITSAAAIEHYRGLEHQWDTLATDLKVRPDRVAATVEKLAEHVHDLEKKLKAAESGERRDLAAELLAGAADAAGVAIVSGTPQVESADDLLTLCDEVRSRRPDSVTVLASAVDGRVAAVVAAGDAAVGRGVKAGDVIKAMLPAIGGKGGGKPTLARGGGPDVGGIEAAVDAGVAAARDALGG